MRTKEQRAILREADAIKAAERKQNKRSRPITGKATRGREINAKHLAMIRQLPCIATLVRSGVEAIAASSCVIFQLREDKDTIREAAARIRTLEGENSPSVAEITAVPQVACPDGYETTGKEGA